MKLNDFEKKLNDKEKDEYNALIVESKLEGQVKTIRSELAKLVRSVL